MSEIVVFRLFNLPIGAENELTVDQEQLFVSISLKLLKL